MAENDDRLSGVFVRRVGAPESGLHADRPKDAGREREPADILRVAVQDDGEAGRSDHTELVERSSTLAPLDEVGHRDAVAHAAAPVGFPDRDEPIGVMVGQRLQHHGADDAEDRGGRPDTEGQRDQRGGREPRRAPQYADAVTHIPEGVIEQRGPDLVARAFPGGFQSAEFQPRLAPRLGGAQAGPAQLLGLLIDVKPDLFVQAVLERAPPADGADPLPALCDASHDCPQLLSVASRTRLTARDMRRHCTSSSLKCRRPAAVSA